MTKDVRRLFAALAAMKTLRAEFALLLVVSIVCVIGLETLVMIYAFTTPKTVEADILARQFVTMEGLARQGLEVGALSRHPASGAMDPDRTDLIRAAMLRQGAPLDVIMTHKPNDSRLRTVSLRVGPRCPVGGRVGGQSHESAAGAP